LANKPCGEGERESPFFQANQGNMNFTQETLHYQVRL